MEKFLQSNYFLKEIGKINYNNKIVFCDIDGTIYRNSLFLDLLENLIEDGYISQYKVAQYNKYKKKWKNREIWYEEFLMYAVIDIFEKLIKTKKLHSSTFMKYTKKILKDNWKHILTYTMDTLKNLQNKWYKVVFISGSPLLMVKEFAKMYNFDIWLGTLLDKDKEWYYNWNCTVLASSESKEEIIKTILNEINPTHTISLWDTKWDLWMLLITDIWVAINPAAELYNAVKEEESILVIIERKDLIIELDKKARQYIKNL